MVSSIGQSQLNQGQQQPDSNCNTNTVAMIGCGSINPNKTTSTPPTNSTQQQHPDSTCNTNTVAMINCGSINPDKTTTTNPYPQTNTSETTNTGGSIGSNKL